MHPAELCWILSQRLEYRAMQVLPQVYFSHLSIAEPQANVKAAKLLHGSHLNHLRVLVVPNKLFILSLGHNPTPLSIQGGDWIEGLLTSCPFPIGFSFLTMESPPFQDQAVNSLRQTPCQHPSVENRNLCSVLAVINLKMWAVFLVKEHENRYPVDAANCGHPWSPPGSIIRTLPWFGNLRANKELQGMARCSSRISTEVISIAH
jgi:hypothetical protein